MPDYTPLETVEHFRAATATDEAAPPKRTVTLELDADLVDWFEQQQAQGGLPWKITAEGVLEFYRDTAAAQQADAEAIMSAPEPAA